MPEPTDKELYNKVKEDIISKYKHSAYRSGLIVKKYKEEYEKKHKNNNAYTGSKSNSNLKRWFDEKWINQRGEIGYNKKGDIYRPSIRITDETPKTWEELTPKRIKEASKEKATKGRVKRF
jgi:hypothetical protein